MRENLVLKAKHESFNVVSPDMKLEQTIQRAKKSEGGFIGQIREASNKTECELPYNETLAIRNKYHEMTSGGIIFSDAEVHYERGTTVSQQLN